MQQGQEQSQEVNIQQILQTQQAQIDELQQTLIALVQESTRKEIEGEENQNV